MEDNTPDDRIVKKEVSITAYTKRYHTDDKRDFLAALLGQTEWDGDVYETSTSTSKNHYVTFGSGDNAEKVSISRREYRRLCERRDTDGLDLGDITFKVEEERSTSNVHSLYSLTTDFRDELALTLPDTIAGLVRESTQDDPGTSWPNDTDWTDAQEQQITLGASKPSGERVLRHQQERTENDRFETPDEYLALSASVDLKSRTQSQMDRMSSEVVKPLYDTLSGFDGVWKVRLADCKTVQESYGDCYDI